ncbi:MAG: hypothetical protein KME45_19455 [Stenomitos rutilans HA7619-LM2]|nr:hypothetical protein [Stenomitos rutilans HA7619-LM2]
MGQPNLEDQINREIEILSLNQLHELGNQAVKQGLLIGHGHRGGRYELLSKEEVMLLSPQEAQDYLQTLLGQADGSA